MRLWLIAATCIATAISTRSNEHEARWWPVQALPKTVVRTVRDFPGQRRALEMMIQSVAGLAAQAVNEGRGDELVWVDNGNADLEDWFSRWRAMHPNIRSSGSFGPWELVDRFTEHNLIKGYIIYRLDQSNGDLNTYRSRMDSSVNVATSLAGLLQGIIVDEAIEKEASAHGLKRLIDVRGKTEVWCFETYRDRFNRAILCTQDPKKPHIRDLAVSQKAFTVYGNREPTPSALAWLEPLSPILGWNGGDEFETTDLSTRYGHLQTATDWCMNLPVLMAGSEKLEPARANILSPTEIDWSDQRAAVSFVETDGDNVQWFQGNFFRGNPSYWSNPDRGRISFGWSCCFAQLAQLCPQAIDYAFATRMPNDSFIEWGGGYYYPDHFAMNRKDRWDLLARQAQRTWTLMQRTGTRIIGFNVHQHDSADTRKACEAFARETDGLLGILIFQYAPYEAGGGKRFWVKDRNGNDVPVIAARYSIWEHANNRPRAGTPAKIAREIRDTVEKANSTDDPRYDWVICHTWSWFRKAPGADEDAENLLQTDATLQGGLRGYTPVTWCAERLPANIRVISPEELIWGVRMQHNPEETKRFLARFK
jgi:hypothetical protein